MKIAILAAIAFALAPSAYAGETVTTVRGAGCFRTTGTSLGYINLIPIGRKVTVNCWKEGAYHEAGGDYSSYWYKTPYGCWLSGVDFAEYPRDNLPPC